MSKPSIPGKPAQPNLFELLVPYKGIIFVLLLLALGSNGLNLLLPKLISHAIDNFIFKHAIPPIFGEFFYLSIAIFVLAYLQGIVQTYASEAVARDIRKKLSASISRQSYLFIQRAGSAKLLTNLTSDVDSIKLFVSQAIVSIASSLFIIIGASIILLTIDWKLALAVLTVVPIIGITFAVVLGKVRVLFLKSREVIDWLNKVINESILGSALIRVLNSQQPEYEKFLAANSNAKDIGMQILRLFASMIPIITFVSNLASLIILALGGHYVITKAMTLGDFAAFTSYLAILIFPILIIGFMSNVIAQATASYQRILEVLNQPIPEITGKRTDILTGAMSLNDIKLAYGQKPVLKDINLDISAGTKTAIIGPTAAGKTQLLYLLTGLTNPDSGSVEYDGHNIADYQPEALHQQIGFVFQDSIIFNMSLRENIAFNGAVNSIDMQRAIETAELDDFLGTLDKGLDTIVSERGSTLSGGQKQRVMLARALALNPRILLLDDFTARVDSRTERKILANIEKNYPHLTLLSVTQKIASVEHYDQIILLMEGEILARGTHEHLMASSPEYVQIYNSQQSTSHYEL